MGAVGGGDEHLRSSLGEMSSDGSDQEAQETSINGGGHSALRADGDKKLSRRDLPPRKINLHHLLQELVFVISDLTAACLNIERVVGQAHNHSFHHFAVYLKVLEAYGCGYAEDIDSRGYKIRDSRSHKLTAIKQLQDIQRMYDIAIAQVSDPRHFSVAAQPNRHQTKS